MTYLRTTSGGTYLAVVMDAYSRRIIGWEYGARMTADLPLAALAKAVAQRGDTRGCIAHSDRGSQYTSTKYQAFLAQSGLHCSMTGKGCCYDNALVERFFGTLKDWLVVGETPVSPTVMKDKIARWLVIDYNAVRSHSALAGRSPMQFERIDYARQAA